jgi:hypothetical protein
MVASLKVCSPDMEVSFKPLAVCLSAWTTI